MSNVTSIRRAKLRAIADEYGELDHQIKRLEERKKELREEILAKAVQAGNKWDGERWRLKLSESLRSSVNWRGLAEKLGATERQIESFTTYNEVKTIRTELL